MTIYTEAISITAPAELADTAAKIGRALDPDVGGADSFTPSADGKTISMVTQCTPAYKAQTAFFISNPAALYAAVAAAYADRSYLAPPTQAECEEFCAGVAQCNASSLPESFTMQGGM